MKKRLGDLLVEAGLINENQLTAGLGEQQQWGGKLGSVLVGKGFISEADLLRVLARQMGVKFVSIWKEGINPKAVKLMKPEVAKEHNIFPFAVTDDIVTVAMTDPRNLQLIDAVEFATGRKLKPVLAELEEIKLAIRKYYDKEVIQDWEFENLFQEIERKKHAAMPDPGAFGRTVEIGENGVVEDKEAGEAGDIPFDEPDPALGAVEAKEIHLDAPDPSALPADHTALLSENKPSKPKPKKQPKEKEKTKRSPIIIEKTLVSLINVLIRNGVISKEDLVEEMNKDKNNK